MAKKHKTNKMNSVSLPDAINVPKFLLFFISLIIVGRLCWLENSQWMRIIEMTLSLIGWWLKNELDNKTYKDLSFTVPDLDFSYFTTTTTSNSDNGATSNNLEVD